MARAAQAGDKAEAYLVGNGDAVRERLERASSPASCRTSALPSIGAFALGRLGDLAAEAQAAAG